MKIAVIGTQRASQGKNYLAALARRHEILDLTHPQASALDHIKDLLSQQASLRKQDLIVLDHLAGDAISIQKMLAQQGRHCENLYALLHQLGRPVLNLQFPLPPGLRGENALLADLLALSRDCGFASLDLDGVLPTGPDASIAPHVSFLAGVGLAELIERRFTPSAVTAEAAREGGKFSLFKGFSASRQEERAEALVSPYSIVSAGELIGKRDAAGLVLSQGEQLQLKLPRTAKADLVAVDYRATFPADSFRFAVDQFACTLSANSGETVLGVLDEPVPIAESFWVSLPICGAPGEASENLGQLEIDALLLYSGRQLSKPQATTPGDCLDSALLSEFLAAALPDSAFAHHAQCAYIDQCTVMPQIDSTVIEEIPSGNPLEPDAAAPVQVQNEVQNAVQGEVQGEDQGEDKW